jgi:hypothetical protein
MANNTNQYSLSLLSTQFNLNHCINLTAENLKAEQQKKSREEL